MQPFSVESKVTDSKYYTTKINASFFDEEGYPRLINETETTYAKAIKNRLSRNFTDDRDLGYSFYIKTDPNKNIYDPTKRYSLRENKQNFINRICKDQSSFTEVSESVFNSYINFLKTENSQWLTKTQRDLR